MTILDGRLEHIIAHHVRSADGWSSSVESGVAESSLVPQKTSRCQYVVASREVPCLEPLPYRHYTVTIPLLSLDKSTSSAHAGYDTCMPPLLPLPPGTLPRAGRRALQRGAVLEQEEPARQGEPSKPSQWKETVKSGLPATQHPPATPARDTRPLHESR